MANDQQQAVEVGKEAFTFSFHIRASFKVRFIKTNLKGIALRLQ